MCVRGSNVCGTSFVRLFYGRPNKRTFGDMFTYGSRSGRNNQVKWITALVRQFICLAAHTQGDRDRERTTTTSLSISKEPPRN